MKITLTKLGSDLRMSMEPENEAEIHQLNHVQGMMQANGEKPARWKLIDEHLSGLVFSVKGIV